MGIPGTGLSWAPRTKLTDAQMLALLTPCKDCRRWIVPGIHEREYKNGQVTLGFVHKGGCPE